MKKQIVCLSGLLLMLSCTNSGTNDSAVQSADSALQTGNTQQASTLCYRFTDGQQNQDTTILQLTVNGSAVSGQLLWLPYEKDTRVGTIKGTKQENSITGIWTFMQEGMRDSLPVAFQIKGNAIYQKPYGIDTVSGRQILNDKAGYTIPYKPMDCKRFSTSSDF